MGRARYTDDERSRALELAARVGVGEASRLTGIAKGTIGSWAHRAGTTVANTPERAELVRVAQMAWAERRAGLADELGHIAGRAVTLLLARIEDEDIGNRDLVAAVSALIDRAQLLSGGATGRQETLVTRAQALEEARERAGHLRAVS